MIITRGSYPQAQLWHEGEIVRDWVSFDTTTHVVKECIHLPDGTIVFRNGVPWIVDVLRHGLELR